MLGHHRLLRSLPAVPLHWSWSLPAVVEPSPLRGLICRCRCAVCCGAGIQLHIRGRELSLPGDLPPTRDHFPDLEQACTRLVAACRSRERVAICGDYDADGMTSTALLLRALAPLGAEPEPAIPSRMERDMASIPPWCSGSTTMECGCWSPLITGCREGSPRTGRKFVMQVIVTDHHTIPAERPP